MNRRTFLSTSASLVLSSALSAGTKGETRRPNVVMIVGDDMGWPDFGFMGHPVIQTPRIDRLAKESAIFPNGYVPTSLCRASLATLLTGLYPHQHHICCNDPPEGIDRTEMHPFIRRAPALPRILAKAGYRSLQTGKFWEGHFSNAGFTEGETTDKDRHIARPPREQIGRATMQPITDFIDRNQKQPFFVWYAPMLPHRPHNPPERLLKRYLAKDRPRNYSLYYAMCEWFDETVGQLLDHLEKRRLTDNTFIVFCNDNGWVQPVGKEDDKGPFGAERGKRSPYDMGIRTPFLLKLPGVTRAGRHDDLVSTVDVAPTILRACNADVPREMQGLSLLDVARGKGRLDRNAVFGEIYTHTASKLGAPNLDVTHRWVRQGDWKLIQHLTGKRNVELFDLARDPQERTNQAEKQAGRVKDLREQIDLWVRKR